jgi:threonine/homoserine/homoserine lactone efflux protein
MNAYFAEFIAVTSIFTLVLISPGPDFVLIVRNSLVYSRRTGLYSAFGVALGILVHVSYSLMGLGLIISQSILLFSVMKYLGAGYLIYIGYKSLRSKPSQLSISKDTIQKDISKAQAVKIGFLTNVLNPKATLLFLALFTQVISQTTPITIKIFYGLEMSGLVFAWFSLVTVILSHQKNKSAIH